MLYKLVYFWIFRPNSSIEEDQGGIFSKDPEWKPLFFRKIKIKQNPGCPNNKISAIFGAHTSEYQDLSQKYKSALIKDWGNIAH